MAVPKILTIEDYQDVARGKKTKAQLKKLKVQLGVPTTKALNGPHNGLAKKQNRMAKTVFGMPNMGFNLEGDALNLSTPDGRVSQADFNAMFSGPLISPKGQTSKNKNKPGTLSTFGEMLAFDNYKDPTFSQTTRAPKTIGSTRIVKIKARPGNIYGSDANPFGLELVAAPKVKYKTEAGRRKLARAAPVTISRKIQTLQNYASIPSISPGVFSNIYSIGKGTKIDGVKLGKTYQTQQQFSTNIKLASAGISLGDPIARAAVTASSAASNARLTKISRARSAASSAALSNSPNLAAANSILASQGANYRIKVYSRRRRRGRWAPAQYIKYYVGPSTRRSYTRIIHNGRRVTAYRGMSPGQHMGGADPVGIINTHNQKQAVVNWAVENKVQEYVPVTFTAAENKQMAEYRTQLSKMSTAKIKRRYRGSAASMRKWRPPYKNQAARNVIQAKIDAILAKKKTGAAKTARHYDQIMGTVSTKQAMAEKYIAPLGGAGSDIGKKVAAKRRELASVGATSSPYAIVRRRGKNSRRISPATQAAYRANAARKVVLNRELALLVQEQSDAKFGYATITNEQLDDLATYSSDLRTSTIGFDENIGILQQGIAKVQVARGKATKQRTASKRYGQAISLYDTIESREKPFDSKISSESAQLASIGDQLTDVRSDFATSFGAKAIGKTAGVIATPANKVITASGYRGRSAYRARTGSITIRIPKDKIPANGKVVIEAVVRYAGYKGPVRTVTSLGTVTGSRHGRSQTVRKEVPVDANGNITIHASMTGNTRAYATKTYLSNIKVIDPSSTQAGAHLVSQRISLSSQQTDLTSSLKGNKAVKSYFDDAQEFLLGKSQVLKGTGGKTIATYDTNKKLSIKDQSKFTDTFGGIGANVFDATRSIYEPVTKLDASIKTLSSKIAPTSAASLKTQIASAVKAATNANYAASRVSGLNQTDIHRKTSARNQQASLRRQAASHTAKANVLKAELARVEGGQYYSGTQLATRKERVSNLTSFRDFLTGGGQDFKIGENIVASRGQLGKIDILDQDAFSNLGITVHKDLLRTDPKATTLTRIDALEALAKQKEGVQKELITELKSVQKSRIKENAAAQVTQINQLVRKRAISRREAAKMKSDVSKTIATQTRQIDNVDGSVPIPDIDVFDTDLRSEAQRILAETGKIVRGVKKQSARARLRQVTRPRKPATSPVGAVLRVGATVPRPRQQRQTQGTSLSAQPTRLPFLTG